jgi:hypothetical protein
MPFRSDVIAEVGAILGKTGAGRSVRMKSYAISTAVLSLLLTAACADRGDNNAQNVDENKAPAATEPADRDSAAAREGATEGARATSGTRPSRRSGAPRSNAAARSEDRARPDRAETPRASETASNAAPARRSVEWREATIPEGTALPLELETSLSSETAQVEAPVRARLKQAVVVNGVTALPAGAIVSGNVTSVQRAGRVKGRSGLAFTFNQVRADNVSAGIRTAPLSYVGEASKGEDATKIGAGAVGGAIVGGIVGGGEGAAKGAAIGGAAGTGVVLATRGREVELASGTDIAVTLTAPVTIRVALR